MAIAVVVGVGFGGGCRVGGRTEQHVGVTLGEKVGHIVLSRTVPEVDVAVSDVLPKPVVDGPDVLVCRDTRLV